MNRSFQIQVLGVAAAVAIGIVAGGAITLQYLESEVGSESPEIHNNTVEFETPGNFSQEEQNLNELFHSVEHSVVHIEAIGGEREGFLEEDDYSQGSGFVYSSDGHIVTNHHVVSGERNVRVTFTDGSTRTAEVVGTDDYNDLAVLEVDKDDLDPLPLGNLNETVVGQRVVALGSPFGLRGSMTVGYISQKDRVLQAGGGFSIPDVIQTDAAINPGNSGGPLLNLRGEVVGVNTAIHSETGTFSGVGFAVPSSAVERVVPELIEDGEYQHSWIGVEGVDMSEELADEIGKERSTGFMVVDVIEEGPADRAGIRGGNRSVEIFGDTQIVGGDVIIGIDEREIRDIGDILSHLASETEVGDTIVVEVWRDGKTVEKEVELESRPN